MLLGEVVMSKTTFIMCLFLTGTAALAAVERVATDSGTVFLEPVTDMDWGRPLASGDLDNDGYDDLLVSASESTGGEISRVYIIRGQEGAEGLGVVDLASVTPDQVILDATSNGNLGSSMATGDVNGDGIDDLLVCASTADTGQPGSGIAYLIFGNTHFFESQVRDLAETTNWDLRIYGPTAGADLGGASSFGGMDGQGAAIGDINGDNYGDLVLGAHLAPGAASQAGRVYVIYGLPFPPGFTISLASLSSNFGFHVEGKVEYDELGKVVKTADITGDGIDDLILPNEYYSHGAGYFATEGAVHIYRGRTSWSSVYRLINGPADITLLGVGRWDELGAAAAVGDFNNDGIMDLVASAPGADVGAWDQNFGEGFTYGLLGSSVYQTGTHTIDYASADPDFVLVGETHQGLGAELTAGDFNGDGYDDVAASSRDWGTQSQGVVEVLFGRDFSGSPVFNANVDTDLRIAGAEPSAQFCDKIGTANMNNDCLDEIVIATPFDHESKGRVHLFTYSNKYAVPDGDHDLADYAAFQACFTCSVLPVVGDGCCVWDFDTDGDVDVDDLGELVNLLDGPN